MGWQERDYTWFPERGARMELLRAYMPPRAMTTVLIVHVVATIAVIIARATTGDAVVDEWTILIAGRPHVGALLLYPFGTPSFLMTVAILGAIGSLGGRIEIMLGARTAVWQYVLGNLFGGLTFVAVSSVRPELGAWPLAAPVGGVAAWVATLAGRLSFESRLFFGHPVKLWVVGLFCIGLAAGSGAFAHGIGIVAWLCAGAVGAMIPAFLDAIGGVIGPRKRSVRGTVRGSRTASKQVARVPLDDRLPSDGPDAGRAEEGVDLDAILAKISRSGIGSLTDDERDALEAARQARLRDAQTRPR